LLVQYLGLSGRNPVFANAKLARFVEKICLIDPTKILNRKWRLPILMALVTTMLAGRDNIDGRNVLFKREAQLRASNIVKDTVLDSPRSRGCTSNAG
jgi:hypothetical protein